MLRLVWVCLLLASSLTAAKNLNIYVIDVEGGKSVLFVSPTGESMLFDVGWPASNTRVASTDRIVEVARAAGLKRIDHLVISHYDVDHVGDVAKLLAAFPVGHIYDHGDAPKNPRFAAYSAARNALPHTTLRVGDKVPLQGVGVEVLTSAGEWKKAGKGGRNASCDTNKQVEPRATDFEDDQSLGLLITTGKFRMLDLADLEAHNSHDLVCPNNLIGRVSLYNVNVHGQFKGIAPELLAAIQAPVMIQANGARKGADAQTWPVLKAAPGVRDIWQVHTSVNAGPGANPPDDFIANLEPADGFRWLHISAEKSGSFTVTNTRNGFRRQYSGSGDTNP